MNRRNFIKILLGGSAIIVAAPLIAKIPVIEKSKYHKYIPGKAAVFSNDKGEIVFGDLDNTGHMTVQSSGFIGIGPITPTNLIFRLNGARV